MAATRLRQNFGMVAKATEALAKASVNIEMMNQGSSEISMMFGVKAARTASRRFTASTTGHTKPVTRDIFALETVAGKERRVAKLLSGIEADPGQQLLESAGVERTSVLGAKAKCDPRTKEEVIDVI